MRRVPMRSTPGLQVHLDSVSACDKPVTTVDACTVAPPSHFRSDIVGATLGVAQGRHKACRYKGYQVRSFG